MEDKLSARKLQPQNSREEGSSDALRHMVPEIWVLQ